MDGTDLPDPIAWASGIQAIYIESVWKQAAPLIERALNVNRGEYNLEDIRAAIVARDMQLWVYGEGSMIRAVAVTEIVRYPRRMVALVILCAGDSLAKWRGRVGLMEAWARKQGCVEIKAIGRIGWARALGWQVLDTVTGRALT